MGLDMYLTRKTYVKKWDFDEPENQFDVVVKRGGKPYPKIEQNKIQTIIEEIAYWRKANAIHKWFVDNVQGGVDECQESYVGIEQLADLVNLCKQVLEDNSKAMELLPPQAGFFFGDTDTGEWYIKSLKSTIEQLEPIIEREKKDQSQDYYYESSW